MKQGNKGGDVDAKPVSFTVQTCTITDYDALARFHYREGRPATCARVLVAHDQHNPQDRATRIGVLVISMPAINGPWRERAWPGRYRARKACTRERSACLRRINAELRVISRVVVEPRWRACGVAQALVRAYLRDPLTKRTEALAAMGRICPFFARAGMREVEYPPALRTARLRKELLEMGIQPWRLVDVDEIAKTHKGERGHALHRILRTFALAHRDTRDSADATLPELIALAARRVACRPLAYVAEYADTTESPAQAAGMGDT